MLKSLADGVDAASKAEKDKTDLVYAIFSNNSLEKSVLEQEVWRSNS